MGTSGTVSANKETLNLSTRKIVGTSLIGSRGKTEKDQNKINATVARLCSTKVWTKSECVRHGQEVADQMQGRK